MAIPGRRIAELRAQMGASAARAVGDDIPRPKPTYDASNWRVQQRLEEIRRQREAELRAEPAAAQAAGPAPVVVPEGVTVVQVGPEGRYVAVDAAGNELFDLGKPKSGRFAFPDGTIREADGTIVGGTNAPPPPKTDAELEALAGRIWQADRSLQEPLESFSPTVLRQLGAELQTLTPEDTARLLGALSPDATEAAERLARITDSAVPENAKAVIGRKLQQAVAAVTEPGTPRPRSALPAAQQELVAAQELAVEGLGLQNDGSMASLARVFNALDPEVQSSVLRSMPEDSRGLLARAVDGGGGSLQISPNSLALLANPHNDEIVELFQQLDAARRGGDTATAEGIDALLREARQQDPERFGRALQDFTGHVAMRDALRRAVIAETDMMTEARAGVLDAAVPQGQPSLPTQGSRTPELVTRALDDRELPGPAITDEMAARAAAEERRTAGGGRDADWRMRRFQEVTGVEPKDQGDLPLFLRGRDDREVGVLETRAGRERELGTRDTEAVAFAQAREAEVAAAQADMDRAREALEASGVDLATLDAGSLTPEQAAIAVTYLEAGERYDAAYKALDQRFGRGSKEPDASRLGRKAASDAALNRPSPQDTLNQLVFTIVGGRPKAQRNLNRASDAMSADEVASVISEVEDAAPAFVEQAKWQAPWNLDDDAADAVTRRKRLGGRQQLSRQMDASRRLFGDYNPLDFYGTSQEAARDILSRTDAFRAGSDELAIAEERLAAVIDKLYEKPTAQRIQPATDAPSPSPDFSARTGVGTSQNVEDIPREGIRDYRGMGRGVPNQPGTIDTMSPAELQAEYERLNALFERVVRDPNYLRTVDSEVLPWRPTGKKGAMEPVKIDSGEVPYQQPPQRPRTSRDFSEPVTAADAQAVDDVDVEPIPSQAGRTDAGDANLAASAVDVTDADIDDLVDQLVEYLRGDNSAAVAKVIEDATAAGADPAAVQKAVRDEMMKIFRATADDGVTLEQWADGLTGEQFDNLALDASLEKPSGKKRGGGKGRGKKNQPATQAADEAAMPGRDGDDAPDLESIPERPRDTAADGGSGGRGGDGDPPATPDAPKPEPAKTPDKKKGFPWRRAALVAGAGGLVANWLGRDTNILRGDVPGGAGGGGGAGGADFPPVPPGYSDAELAALSRINKEKELESLLDRISGRTLPRDSRTPLQTYQNFNY